MKLHHHALRYFHTDELAELTHYVQLCRLPSPRRPLDVLHHPPPMPKILLDGLRSGPRVLPGPARPVLILKKRWIRSQ
jgi:hypothetical protein